MLTIFQELKRSIPDACASQILLREPPPPPTHPSCLSHTRLQTIGVEIPKELPDLRASLVG